MATPRMRISRHLEHFHFESHTVAPLSVTFLRIEVIPLSLLQFNRETFTTQMTFEAMMRGHSKASLVGSQGGCPNLMIT